MSDEVSSVGATESGSGSVDAGVAELTNDFYSTSEPETADATGTEESGEQSAQFEETQPVAEKPVAQPRKAERAVAPVVAEQKLKYRGREYTPEDLVKNPALLEAILQSAEQFPHIQQKYLDVLEKQRNQPAAQPSPVQAGGQAQQGGINPQRILQEFLPEAQAMEQAGYFDPGFTEANPLLAANLTGYRKVLENVATVVDQMRAERQGQQQYQQVSQVAQSLDRGIDSLPTLGQQFKPLENPEVRNAFREFLINDLNPETSKITGEKGQEFLARAYFAFSYQAIAAQQQQQATQAQNARTVTRRNAAGEAGSARPTTVATDPWANELASFGVSEQGGRLLR